MRCCEQGQKMKAKFPAAGEPALRRKSSIFSGEQVQLLVARWREKRERLRNRNRPSLGGGSN